MTDSPAAVPRRTLNAALTALAALALLAVAPPADAKKKKRQGAAGTYVGVTAHIGAGQYPKVSFQLTPDGTIVNFTITNVPLNCHIETRMPEPPSYSKQDTITAPPMSFVAVGGAKLPMGQSFHYQDPLPPPPPTFGPPPPLGSPPYRGIYVRATSTVLRPKPFSQPPFGPGFAGRANLATFNNTRGATGTEHCHADSTLWDPEEFQPGFEWKAVKQVRKKRKRK